MARILPCFSGQNSSVFREVKGGTLMNDRNQNERNQNQNDRNQNQNDRNQNQNDRNQNERNQNRK